MTDSNYTLIGVLVDRSGSMSVCKTDMEGGLATLLAEQAKADNRVEATLAQFDTSYDIVYKPTPIKDVPTYTLIPRGGTALLDGMGRFITEIGEYLAKKKEHKRPGKVLIVIITDGCENSSREFRRDQIKRLITRQRATYNWEFVFLGANMDAVTEAASFGIPLANSMTYTSANTRSAMDSLSSFASTYNSAGAAAFTDKDREDAVSPTP